MPATIKVDALNSQTLKGIVTKVNQYAEQSSWGMSSQIRKYAVFVRIFDPPEELKPGMNASVNIQVQYEKEGLLVPIQAVYGVGDEKYCLVKVGPNRWETRKIVGGGDNSTELLVIDGLKVGEELVLNPGAYKQVMELPAALRDTRIELPEGAAQLVSTEVPDRSGEGMGATANEQPTTNQGGARGRGGMGAGADPEAMVQMMLDRFDTNGDGQLDASELDALEGRMRDRLAQADTDNDGIISREELVESSRRMMEQMQRNGGPGGGERGRGRPGAAVETN